MKTIDLIEHIRKELFEINQAIKECEKELTEYETGVSDFGHYQDLVNWYESLANERDILQDELEELEQE